MRTPSSPSLTLLPRKMEWKVVLRLRGWRPDVAELLGCGSRFIILRRLGWRRRTTFHSILHDKKRAYKKKKRQRRKCKNLMKRQETRDADAEF
jgi:hypothetical protein